MDLRVFTLFQKEKVPQMASCYLTPQTTTTTAGTHSSPGAASLLERTKKEGLDQFLGPTPPPCFIWVHKACCPGKCTCSHFQVSDAPGLSSILGHLCSPVSQHNPLLGLWGQIEQEVRISRLIGHGPSFQPRDFPQD